VQAGLSRNRRDRGGLRASSGALLQGRIFNGSGERMTPTHANKNGVRYRYYVSRRILRGGPQQGVLCPGCRPRSLSGR